MICFTYQARDYLSAEEIFKREVSESLLKVQMTLDILQLFRHTYEDRRTNLDQYQHSEKSVKPWDFPSLLVFSGLNRFIGRVNTAKVSQKNCIYIYIYIHVILDLLQTATVPLPFLLLQFFFKLLCFDFTRSSSISFIIQFHINSVHIIQFQLKKIVYCCEFKKKYPSHHIELKHQFVFVFNKIFW